MPNSMDRCSAPSPELTEGGAGFAPKPAELEFPDAPDFISKPPRLPWHVIFQRSQERLAAKASQPAFEERRLQAKTPAEFVL